MVVISGKDRGKTGEVLRVLPKKKKIVVDGLNLVLKNIRPRQAGQKGQQVRLPSAIDASNVKLVCPSCRKGQRAGQKLDKDAKVRYCKKCGKVV